MATDSPTTVQDVIDRLRAIDAAGHAGLAPAGQGVDGAVVFNRVYLTVTERVAAGLEEGSFRDDAFMAELDVRFAGLWLDAYDAAEAGHKLPKAWAPLFESRDRNRVLPIQFALAGMNAHIEYDLAVAVVATCRSRDREPEDDGVHADFEAVNALLAEEEARIRRSFLTDVGQAADEHVGPVTHLVSSWSIDKARDIAWVSVEAMWALRRFNRLAERHRAALARTVGMASRCLLAPVSPPNLGR